MISEPRQFCKIILYCMERYSISTQIRVGNLLNTHERVIQIEKMVDTNPSEQELLKMLDEAYPIEE